MPAFARALRVLLSVAAAIAFAVLTAPANAQQLHDPDTVLEMQALMDNFNAYAPSAVVAEGLTYLYYSGWETEAHKPNDHIYLRTSFNGRNWSQSQTVIRHDDLPNVHHVGDPSVTYRDGAFTMFYTACIAPCDDGQFRNQVWSAVSSDGIHWSGHEPLVANSGGAAEPSAILDPETGGFKVYWVERLNAQVVKMGWVDADRNLTGAKGVFKYVNSYDAISGVEVRELNGKWHLWFNVFVGYPLQRVDVYKSESWQNEWFPQGRRAVIENVGPYFCSTTTPGVLPVGDGEYDLFFGLVPREEDGSCDLTRHEHMHRWRWAD